jgi:crotonobetainyl-CoA:carnitine CoA-transferase CaiB-like acyl-CoA transferase
MRPKPLAGLRILDLTRLLPGPMCTMHLADMGAEVIKIEDPHAGDYGRGLGPVKTANSGLYLAANRNKRGLRLDLKQAAGREVFLRLARGADAVVEGFRPGVMQRLGIGYPELKRLNPRLVFCSITGYGQDGPWSRRAGHDLNYCALAGVADQVGVAGGEPAIPNFLLGDLLGGALTAAMGILAALVEAGRSGEGRQVDVAMADAVLAHAIMPLAALIAGQPVPPRGEDLFSGREACYAIYRTADGRHMAVAALERKFWDRLCEALGRPELKPLHLAPGVEGARARRELAAVFAARPQSHWIELFRDVDCCVTPLLRLDEALENEHFAARGMVVRAAHPVDGEVLQLALPLKFSDFEFEVVRPAPRPGEHSEEILAQAGYSPAEIGALRAEGVI